MNDDEATTGATQPVVYIQPITPARAMAITLAVLFVLGAVWLLIQIREIVLLLILGILLAAAIEPIVNRLRRAGLSRGQSILVVYGAIVVAVAALLALVVPPLYQQGYGFVTNIPDFLARFREQAVTSSNPTLRDAGVRSLDRAMALYDSWLKNPPIQATQVSQAIGFLTSFVGVVFTTFSVLIVAYYWMTEKGIIKRVILGIVPLARRDRAHRLWDEIELRLGGWARGQLVLMLAIGASATIAYAALQLPFWFLLGIWAGLTELIPFIGPWLGGGLAFIVALTDSWQKAVAVAVVVFLLQQLEGSVLVPRVMKNAVGLTPLAVILAILIGGTLLGPLGALLAIPVAAAVQVLVADLLREREEADDDREPAVAVSISTVRVEETAPETERARDRPRADAPTGAAMVASGPAARDGELLD
ncbi:MAG TPA: AI-2E family transporter, partial [Thermomicrobiales bacterium]|nr:AI-2E family transporter [Thermomicrobiales bacterium]